MNKTIKDYTEVELKAFKSDIYEQNQVNANNLQIINTELERRAKEAQEETKAKKK